MANELPTNEIIDPGLYLAPTKETCEKDTNKIRSTYSNSCITKCENWYVESGGIQTDECLINGYGSLWIQCGPEELRAGTCKRNINKTLWIRNSETTPNPTLMLQDIVLAATSFIGTVIMIALVVMWVKYVRWWFDESASGDLKWNIKKLIIGLFLVIGSYTIIRLIQYVARWY